MLPKSWEEGIRTGLQEIADLPSLDPPDRYRLVVLWARWDQFLRSGGEAGTEPLAVPMPVREEVLRHLEGFRIPDSAALLDNLEQHLQSTEDATGPLMDVLLDIDDLAGVRELVGEPEAAHDLARMAAAAASLFPERLVDLSPWAFGRLETLSEDAAVVALWTVVAESPAQSIASRLPAPTSNRLVDAVLGDLEKAGAFEDMGRVIQMRPARVRTESVWMPMPSELFLAAAATANAEPREFRSADGRYRGWVEADGDRMRMEIRGPGEAPKRIALVACEKDGTSELARIELAVEVSGPTAYADLGPWAGSGNVLHQLVERVGRPPGDFESRLVVIDD